MPKNATGKLNPLKLSNEWFRVPSFAMEVNGGNVIPSSIFEDGSPNYTMLPHYHDFYELVVVTNGVALQHIGDCEMTVTAGDIFVILPDTVHYFERLENLALFNILFDPKRLQLPWDMLSKLPGFDMLFQIEPKLNYPVEFKSRLSLDTDHLSQMYSLLHKMAAEIEVRPQGFEASLMAMAIEVFVLLGRQYRHNTIGDRAAISRVSQAIALMEREFASDLTIEDIANSVNTSPRHFQRLFRRATDSQPVEYLNAIRLRHAVEALADMNRSVLDVAYSCGFKSPSYFAKLFRKAYGVTPAKYRRN